MRVAGDYSYGKSNLEDMKRSLPLFAMIMIATVGVVWLAFNNVPAGLIYTMLLVFFVVVYILAMIFTKSTDASYEIPISASLFDSVFLFILGWSIPIVFFVTGVLFTPKYIVPLAFSGASSISTQSFAVLSALADPFWRVFIVVISAGTIEEISIGFSAVLGGILVGYLIRKLINLELSKSGNKWFDFVIAMIFTTIFFAILHTLNSSYSVLSMFVIAMVFRLLMNFSIYLLNLGLAFTIAFHQSNNAIALGLNNVLTGMLANPFGWIIIFLFMLMIFYFVTNLKLLVPSIKRLIKEVGL